MNRKELVDRYFKERLAQDEHFGNYPFVTISRQAGAGGHPLAELLLVKFEALHYTDTFRGWKIFDDELCEAVAQEPDLHVSMQSLLSEEYHTAVTDVVKQLLSKETPQLAVYERIFHLEQMLATIGKVILVGRGSSFVTRDMPQGIRIRLTAPLGLRVDHRAKTLNLDEDEARRLVTRHDKERAEFVADLFGAKIEDAATYDRVWDTSLTPLDEIADAVVEMVRKRDKAHGRS